MKKLFESADRYLANSDWKDLTLIKFCLFSIGVLIGVHVLDKDKKKVKAAAGVVFVATYIPLMAKYFTILLNREDDAEFEESELFEIEDNE